MTQQIRLWEITSDRNLAEIRNRRIPLEKNLEDWLAGDISMLDSNLLVIGRQVQTDFGGIIDLLCIDNSGDLVVVELKKGRTPREVTAQALDYASWVRNLSSQKLIEIAEDHLGEVGALDQAFQNKFNQELPETINTSHRSLIVAESLDASTERIVQYLSDLDVPINVLTVQHFEDASGRQMLAQVYLMEPEVAVTKSRSHSKRTSYKTLDQLQSLAETKGIGDLYREVRRGVRGILSAQPYSESVAYRAKRDDGGVRTVMFIGAVPPQNGGLRFTIHSTRFQELLEINIQDLRNSLPDSTNDARVSHWVGASEDERQNAQGLRGTFQTSEEVGKFVNLLKNNARKT